MHNIPIIDRPEDFKIWFRGGRKNFTPRDLGTFIASMKKWWSSIQPVDHARDAHGLFKHDLEDINWSRLYRAGRNGMYLVVVGLMWWREGLENDEGLDAWFVMVEDVTWVLVRLVATHQIERSPTPPPSLSPRPHRSSAKRGRGIVEEPTSVGIALSRGKRTKTIA